MEQQRLLPIILKALKGKNQVRFDIGTFRLIERKNTVITLLKTGKVKKVKPYKAVFFSASVTLKRGLNK